MRPGRRRYLKIRRWFDQTLAGPSGRRAVVFAMLPALPGIWLLSRDGGFEHMLGLTLCGFGLSGCGFVCWRCARLLQAARLQSGRHYERSGRRNLPPDYADSEDALMAAIRAKGASRRARREG